MEGGDGGGRAGTDTLGPVGGIVYELSDTQLLGCQVGRGGTDGAD